MRQILLISFMCIQVFSFAQNGITWTNSGNIAASLYSNMHPRIALDAQNNPLVIWGRMADASVLFSRWNGAMFTMPVKVNPVWMQVATGSWMGPDIASKGDTVYIIIKRAPEMSDTNRVFIFSSFNGGVSFNAPVELAFIADSLSRFPTLTVDANGNPIVAFMKFDSSFGDARWVVSRSNDFGNTFSVDVKASGQSGGVVCDCCPGAIVNFENNVAMLYRTNMNNMRDSWVGVSSDTGNTFPVGFNIDQNNWNIFACPSSGPDGEIISDTLYSVFMNGASGIARTYLSKSFIGGISASSVNLLTGAIPGLGQQNYPRIAASGNAAAIVWKQAVNTVDQLPILFTSNIFNGFPLQYDTVDLNDVSNVDVAVSNGNVFVVWQDDNSGTVKYRIGTYSPTSIDEIDENQFALFPNPVSNLIYIRFKKELNENLEIELINLTGQQVKKQSLVMANGVLKIDISTLNQGIYFLKIKALKELFVSKIIKE